MNLMLDRFLLLQLILDNLEQILVKQKLPMVLMEKVQLYNNHSLFHLKIYNLQLHHQILREKIQGFLKDHHRLHLREPNNLLYLIQ